MVDAGVVNPVLSINNNKHKKKEEQHAKHTSTKPKYWIEENKGGKKIEEPCRVCVISHGA